MSEPYVLSELAQREREEIFVRIAEDNLDAAFRVDQEFEDAFLALSRNPLLGHTRRGVSKRYRLWHLYE